MKYNKIPMKLSMTALAAAMAAAPAVNVAAYTSNPNEQDVITKSTGKIIVHKYDMTAAMNDQVSLDKFKANGKKDETAESALADYVIKGVEFTYYKVGNIVTDSDKGRIEVLYEIPSELRTALGLDEGKTVTDSTGATIGSNCFSSDVINNALKTLLATPSAKDSVDQSKEASKGPDPEWRGDGATNESPQIISPDHMIVGGAHISGKDTLEAAIKTAAGTTGAAVTDENGVAVFDNLPIGLYFIIETKVPSNVHSTVDPFFVSVPMTDLEGSEWFYDIDVYPKNQTDIPTLEKLVRQNDDATLYGRPEYKDTATVSEGEEADYIWVSKLPKITSTATYLTRWKYTDTIDRGCKPSDTADSSVVGFTPTKSEIRFYRTEAEAKANDPSKAVEVWGNKDTKYTVNYGGYNNGFGTMTVNITTEGLNRINTAPELSETYIVFSYSMIIDSASYVVLGDKGMTNTVELDWERTREDDVAKDSTLKDSARTYTYGIQIQKNFEKDGTTGTTKADPTKVQFTLWNETDGHYVRAIYKAEDGAYFVADIKDKSKTEGDVDTNIAGETKPGEATHFRPNASGQLIIYGLEADDYVLTELQTAPGFNLLKEPIHINIKSTYTEFHQTVANLYDKKEDVAGGSQENLYKDEDGVVESERNTDGSVTTKFTPASATVDGKPVDMLAYGKIGASGSDTSAVESNNAFVPMTIINTPGFKLPATGGAGTIAFTVAGCSVAFAGIALLTKKNKKEDK